MDYLLSGTRMDIRADHIIADMTRTIQKRIDETGAFHISKNVGFFISRNPA